MAPFTDCVGPNDCKVRNKSHVALIRHQRVCLVLPIFFYFVHSIVKTVEMMVQRVDFEKKS